jgi:hypothetical protein
LSTCSDLGSRADSGLLGLDLREQLLLEVLGNHQLEDPEVRRGAVHVDAGVLRRAGRLLVGGQQRVFERGHEPLRGDALLPLQDVHGLDYLL